MRGNLELFAHTGRAREVDSVVLDAQQLVDHRLVGPLVKQRRHGIVTTAHARDACECSTLFRTRTRPTT